MKMLSRLILVSSLVCAGALCSARAQLVTYETVSTYAGSQFTASNNVKFGETFSNILGISSLTYNFFNSGSPVPGASLGATFSQWNGTGSSGIAANYTTLVDFGTIVVPAFTGANANGWTTLTNGNGSFNTFTQAFDFGSIYLTNPSAVYSLILTNTSGSTAPFGLGFAPDTFAYGDASIGMFSGVDYTFAQIVVVPNDGSHVVPVPEASTVASLIVIAFVGGLVAFRLRQRRQADFELTVA